MAAGNVVVKRFPSCQVVASNAVAMTVGAAILLAASVLTGERLSLPHDAGTWAAIGYTSLAGSVAVFSLFVYVVRRWTASSASNVMLLMPLVTIAGASVITGEAITAPFVAGGALVLAGVYAGAIRRHRDPEPAAGATRIRHDDGHEPRAARLATPALGRGTGGTG